MRASRLAADGDGEDCFKETAEKVGELKTNLIVAEVGKQEYGDEENKALHERFNIDKDAWPVYKLFPKVRAPKVGAAARRLVSRARRTQGGGDPIDGPTKSEGSKDEQKAALGSFIKVNTGLSVFIGKGQIGAFDDLAEKFVGARCPAPFFRRPPPLLLCSEPCPVTRRRQGCAGRGGEAAGGQGGGDGRRRQVERRVLHQDHEAGE